MIMLVNCFHPINPLSVALLLKAEIIDCSMLWKRVCLQHTMHTLLHTSIIITTLIAQYTARHTHLKAHLCIHFNNHHYTA